MTRFKALSTFRFFIALGFALALLWALPTSAPAAFDNGVLVFDSDRPDGLNAAFDIYTMEGDGSGVTQITDHGGSEPAWNADGTKIAFSTQHDYGDPRAWPENIFHMNPDGGAKTYVIGADPSALSSRCAFNRHPSWSPDGTKIAVQMGGCYVNGQPVEGGVFVVDVATRDVTRLTTNRPGFSADIQPAWSHDGTKIAFAYALGSGYQITVMDPNGENATVLTNVGSNSDPAWSPDDSKIVFMSTRDGNNEIWVIDADGSNPVQLTHTDNTVNNYPDWSPDGTKIAFNSTRDVGGGVDYEIWVMNADGSSPTQLTFNEHTDLRPGWQPAGEAPPPPPVPGTIRILLDANPDGPQDFSFTGSGTIGDFDLDDDSTPTLPSDRSFADLTPDRYTVQQIVPDTWTVVGLTCDDPDGGSSTELGAASATIDLDPGETVVCQYLDVPAPATRIRIVVDAVPDDLQDFSFSGSGAIGNFDLDDDSDPVLPASRLFALSPGSYTVQQTVPGGWGLTGLICDDLDSTTNRGAAMATIDLDLGETVTCTYTDTQLPAPPPAGTIEIAVDAVPDDPQDFGFRVIDQPPVPPPGAGVLFFPFSLDDDSNATLASSVTFASVYVGDYVIRQDALPAGWDLSAITCDDPDGGSNVDVDNATATLDVDDDETVSCTFTTAKLPPPPPSPTGTIDIKVDAFPNDPQDFGFRVIDQPPVPPPGAGVLFLPFSLDDDSDAALPSSTSLPDVYAGSYTIRQDAIPAGWNLTGITCADPDGGSNTDVADREAIIDLDDDETVTCTFSVRAQRGVITIVKDALPDARRDFSFTGSLGDFDLDDDDTFKSPSPLPRQRSFGNLSHGTYTVRERAPGGNFYLTRLICNDPDGGTSADLANRRVNIDIDWGERITCTFTNSQTTLVVVMDAIPDAPKDFSFQGSGDVPDFDLDDDSTLRTPSALSDQRSFGGIAPALYPIREQSPGAGWALTSIVCDDPDGGTTLSLGNRRANIDLDPGETVVCTFTNART